MDVFQEYIKKWDKTGSLERLEQQTLWLEEIEYSPNSQGILGHLKNRKFSQLSSDLQKLYEIFR